MKTNRLILFGTFVLLFAISSCKRNVQDLPPSYNTVDQQSSGQYFDQGVYNPNAYSITLLGPTQVGENWEWVWAVKNNNPGNGNNGTTQDLSHWGMSFASCLDWSTVVGAAHSNDGIHWTSFTPTLEVDPASCVATPVIKFDFGTNGSKTSYYRLTLNHNYQPGPASGYYKSGRKTGCILFNFMGISCYGSWG
jgi:hypothetical protein